MQRRSFTLLALLSIFSIALLTGCQGDVSDNKDKDNSTAKKKDGHSHADKLYWPEKNVEHEGFTLSLGHYRNHFHGGEELEPAVMVSKGDADVGDASITCQLMDGDTAIGKPVAMVFEPKTEEEPARYARGKLTFPEEEKTYQVQFVVNLPDVDEPYENSIDVLCGH